MITLPPKHKMAHINKALEPYKIRAFHVSSLNLVEFYKSGSTDKLMVLNNCKVRDITSDTLNKLVGLI